MGLKESFEHLGQMKKEARLDASKGICIEHEHYDPIICGGVTHCGFCGAITGSVDHLYRIWKRVRENLGLPENASCTENWF